LLKSLKITGDDVKRAVFAADTKFLTPDLVNELMKIMPTNDEIQLFTSSIKLSIKAKKQDMTLMNVILANC
jgi:hypothetical protein